MTDKYSFEQQSAVISALRLPMTILVVCIHFNILLYPLVSKGNVIEYDLTWVQYPITFFSEVLGRVAVPFFFFISGYLFFLKESAFNKEIYYSKLKSRFKSLFIPYVAWWIVAGFLTVIMSKLRLTPTLSIQNFLYGIWLTPDSDWYMSSRINVPLDGPLWFMRDLMVTMILSPLIYALIKRRKIGLCSLVLLSIIYVVFGGMCLPEYFIPGLSFPCILFFSIGAYMGLYKINILNCLSPWTRLLVPLSIILMISDTYLSTYVNPLTYSADLIQNGYIHHMQILCGVPMSIVVGNKMLSKMKFMMLLSSSSFTVFALHKIIIIPLGYVIIYIFHISSFISPVLALTLYLGIILLATTIGIMTYQVIAKSEKMKTLFTGGR